MMAISARQRQSQQQEPQPQQLQQHLSRKLRRNQVYWVWLTRGAMVLATSGSVLIARRSLLESVLQEEILLQEGACHTIEHAGWMRLRVDENAMRTPYAEMTIIETAPEESQWRRLIAKLRTLRLRRARSASCESTMPR